MKPLTKILFAAVVAAVLYLTVANVFAQQTIATWYPIGLGNGGGTPPAPFTNNTANPNVIVTPMMKGGGIGAITTTNVYGGANWTNPGVADSEANSIANGLYITYAIQAAPGYTISFSTNILFFHNSGTGPHSGELQYSTDGVNYSDITAIDYGSQGTAYTVFVTNVLSGYPQLQNVSSTTTNFFRIVNWSATGTAGTWYLANNPSVGTNDFTVIGSVVPVAQNLATWWVDGIASQAGGVPPAPFTNNTAAANVIVYPMMKGLGLGTPTGTAFGEYGGNGWTNAVAGVADSENDSITNGYYITYAIQAANGYAISFFTNVLWAHASSTGPHNGELQYSTDGVNYVDIAPMSYGTGTTSILLTNNLSAIAALQNVPSTITNFFRIVNWGASGTGGTWYVYDVPPAGTPIGTNEFAVIGGVTSLTGGSGPVTVVAPTNPVVSPSSITANAGSTVSFAVTAGGSLASNFWYQIVGSTPTLIPWATSSTLTLTNILGANSGSYFVILTNISGSATSSVVTLSVNDPIIEAQPANTYGLLGGSAQFIVTVGGTSPNYQWYFTDGSGNIVTPVNNGTQTSDSVVSGAGTGALTITNLQPADITNFVVVVTNSYGSVTSSVASLLSVQATAATLAFWNFNGPVFTNTAVDPTSIINPVPYFGVGTALAVGSCYLPGTSPFSGSVDANDGNGFGLGGPPYYSWGTSQYPLTGSNKLNGVQFNVSTVGAKNIMVSYESRVSATASDYERLQYTTNGTDWVDYPASSTFGGVGTTYLPFSYNLTGFPGVANNPDFGVRIVTEFQSTATYGVSGNANYIGTANTYGASGTVTYDLVTFTGDAITNNNAPPIVSGFVDTNTADYIPVTNSFTVSDDTTPLNQLTFSAVSLNPSTVNPSFTFGGSGANRTLIITPNSIAQTVAAAPILVTVTDSNGDSTAAWFLLTLTSQNLPPTNSLASLKTTNTLANSAITVPFTVGDDRTAVSGLTYSGSSDNQTLLPSGNIVFNNQGTANPSITITPSANQLGVALVSITVSDNDSLEPKSTTANIAFMVRPNTNVVAIDYFDYDNGGSLDTASAGFWTHLSGNFGQMKFGSGVVTVDTFDNTENLQTALLGAPYKTSNGYLYSSFVVNMNNPILQPINNGTYFSAFNDGSGNTANVEDLLVVATNGAAPGYYRLGIANLVGATAITAQMFPQDLVPGTNYTVVTALSLTNGFSTLWVNPGSQASPNITDTSVHGGTNVYNISNFELRESGANGGAVSVSYLKVGTTFDSVFPLLSVQPAGTNVIVNWSDPTLGIQSTTNLLSPFVDVIGAAPPYTNNASTNAMMFFRFGQ